MPTPLARKGTDALPRFFTDSELQYQQAFKSGIQMMPSVYVQGIQNAALLYSKKVFESQTGGVASRFIQNVGTTPIYVVINRQGVDVDANTVPNFILKGGTNALDGTGGSIDVAPYKDDVWLFGLNQFNALVTQTFTIEHFDGMGVNQVT